MLVQYHVTVHDHVLPRGEHKFGLLARDQIGGGVVRASLWRRLLIEVHAQVFISECWRHQLRRTLERLRAEGAGELEGKRCLARGVQAIDDDEPTGAAASGALCAQHRDCLW